MSNSSSSLTHNDMDNISSAKLSRTVQRLALNNVTNTTLAQETSSINSNLRTLKSSLNIAKNEGTKIPQLNRRLIHDSTNSVPLRRGHDIASTEMHFQRSKEMEEHDKENHDPFSNESVSTNSTKDTLPNIEKQHELEKERTNLDINKDNDVGRKRPMSAVVEQDEPKKFKVCSVNGTEEYEWEDLDAEDVNDPFMVSEYVNDIFEYLYRLEVITLPNKEDLYKHRNIRQNRDILVNWLVKIHNKFGLLPETLYLAINIMDRFLCKELVQLDKLQLVGTSCLFIASKYEEVYSPSIKHFASETDGACTEEEIKEGEKFILKTLNFNLNYPNPMNFLRRISKADDYDIQSRTLAKFLLEISLVDFRFIGILPSLCAAAAMFLSRKMLGKGKWDGNLIHYSGGYSKDQLAPACRMIMDYLTGPIVHDEFHRKYQSRRFMKASVISVQWALKVRKNDYDIMTLHE
ncbi:hypothetical protein KAFR_0A05420 [Kazachstania africana CBS 2517]|uniref:Uncharacterized protein n=1 Tax=Kazachstania africana (strain ATCC 22294 / BCRC 22015 / CBS 2517 / CECT 1963 / NBRC 1671 / NRRL Y-8276) TaxID=1071382 RepID=H2ANM7_KAZAF|nr:hypothetical protein KAFR_0A05420 [Kazachstania africana CBS 2517]CCF55977.1 hypothetical protein KAFR_0A05420 [Kazachstania africana CBS 2517]